MSTSIYWRSILIQTNWHTRLKKLSDVTGKKIYRLIEEAIVFLEEKNGIQQINGEENHE